MPRRLDSLTAIRFPAAAMVVADHSSVITGRYGLTRLQVGVAFFFVLSGFVLAWGCSEMDARPFYRRRAARIVPVYLLAFLLGLFADITLHKVPTLLTVVATASFTQAWFPRVDLWNQIDAPTWSLSVEAFFYLTFPWVIGWLIRLAPNERRKLLALCVGFVLIWNLLLGSSDPRWTLIWVTARLPLAWLPTFIIGALLCLEVRDGLRISWKLAIASTAVSGIIMSMVGEDSTKVTAVAIVPAALLVVAAASHDLQGRPSPRFLVELGAWSYALFLLHYPLMQLIGRQPWPGAPFVWLGVAIGAIGLAGIVFRAYERPLERFMRGSSHVPH